MGSGPEPIRGYGIHGTALVLVEDERAAFAAALILQELGHAVDVFDRLQDAIPWMESSPYSVIVCGGTVDQLPEVVALQARYHSPAARVLLLGGFETPPDSLAEIGVEVLRPPLSVNGFMERLRPAA